MTKSGNATIAINVRHAPGRGSVSPTGPVAIEGRSAVLTCASDPPGYPEPTFEWWKGARDSRYGYFLEVGQTTQGGVHPLFIIICYLSATEDEIKTV